MTLNLYHKKNVNIQICHVIKEIINYKFNVNVKKIVL